MKTKTTVPFATAVKVLATLVVSSLGVSAPLTETTAVHTRPDPASPAITYLKAGTEPTAAPGTMANTPAGWLAVALPGPFEGYVENKDLTKSLDVKPGASIRVAPKADAGVLTTGEKDDKTTITGLQGRWTQIKLERPLIGYINIGAAPGHLPPIATAPASAAGGGMPPPAPPATYGPADAGRPAPAVGDGGGATLPRQYVGRFVSTRRPLTPRRPYDYALNDEAGKRLAYLDVAKIAVSEQLEKYLDRDVAVFGTASISAGTKDLVIVIESLQLQ